MRTGGTEGGALARAAVGVGEGGPAIGRVADPLDHGAGGVGAPNALLKSSGTQSGAVASLDLALLGVVLLWIIITAS
jgi:hypothetical protein